MQDINTHVYILIYTYIKCVIDISSTVDTPGLWNPRSSALAKAQAERDPSEVRGPSLNHGGGNEANEQR